MPTVVRFCYDVRTYVFLRHGHDISKSHTEGSLRKEPPVRDRHRINVRLLNVAENRKGDAMQVTQIEDCRLKLIRTKSKFTTLQICNERMASPEPAGSSKEGRKSTTQAMQKNRENRNLCCRLSLECGVIAPCHNPSHRCLQDSNHQQPYLNVLVLETRNPYTTSNTRRIQMISHVKPILRIISKTKCHIYPSSMIAPSPLLAR